MPLCFFGGVFAAAAGPVFLGDFVRRDGGIALPLPCKWIRNTGAIVGDGAVGVRAIAICCNNGRAERNRDAGHGDVTMRYHPALTFVTPDTAVHPVVANSTITTPV